MRLDAMLGKSSVGIAKKLDEPTREAALNNSKKQEVWNNNPLRKPYEIPASTLMKHNKV